MRKKSLFQQVTIYLFRYLTSWSLPFFWVCAAAAVPTLDGTWKKVCEDQDGDYVSSQLNSTKNLWALTNVSYEDEACTVKYLQFDRSYTTTWTDTNLDLKLMDAAYTPLSQDVAEVLNEAEFCEISNWKKNKKTSILGKNCSDVDNYTKNQMIYSIYELETIDGSKRLRLGEASENHGGDTVARRHIQLEATAFDLSK